MRDVIPGVWYYWYSTDLVCFKLQWMYTSNFLHANIGLLVTHTYKKQCAGVCEWLLTDFSGGLSQIWVFSQSWDAMSASALLHRQQAHGSCKLIKCSNTEYDLHHGMFHQHARGVTWVWVEKKKEKIMYTKAQFIENIASYATSIM